MAPNPKPVKLPKWATNEAPVPAWAISTAYALDAVVRNGRNIYTCVQAGTSASSGGGPTGTGDNIVDGAGTLRWEYTGVVTSQPAVEPSGWKKITGWLFGEAPPANIFNWLFNNIYTWLSYLDTLLTGFLSFTGPVRFQGPPSWAPSTPYAVGQYVANGGKAYVCAAAGTSAGSGGPTGTGSGIVDNGATWNYVALPWEVQCAAEFGGAVKVTGSLSGSTATFTGTVGAGSVSSSGAVTGTTGAFSQKVSGTASGSNAGVEGTAGASAPGVKGIGSALQSGVEGISGGDNVAGVLGRGGTHSAPGVQGVAGTGVGGGAGVKGVGNSNAYAGEFTTSAGTSLYSTSTTGTAVFAVSGASGHAVAGSAQDGNGLRGTSVGGTGVFGQSDEGAGGVFIRGTQRGAIQLAPVAGNPASPQNGDLWYNQTTHTLCVCLNGTIYTVGTTESS